MDYYLNAEYKNISLIDYVYRPEIDVVFSSIKEEKQLLLSLAELSRSEVGKLLKQEDKKMVIKYIIPTFANFDSAVKIYANWGE